MPDVLATTYQLQGRHTNYGWIIWELHDYETLEEAQHKQQFWNNNNKEVRIVEVTRRVL